MALKIASKTTVVIANINSVRLRCVQSRRGFMSHTVRISEGGRVADSSLVSWTVNGKQVDLDLLDVNGVEWRDAKRVTGLPQSDLIGGALVAKDIEAIAALLWIARRRDDPAIEYESILGALSIRSLQPVADE